MRNPGFFRNKTLGIEQRSLSADKVGTRAEGLGGNLRPFQKKENTRVRRTSGMSQQTSRGSEVRLRRIQAQIRSRKTSVSLFLGFGVTFVFSMFSISRKICNWPACAPLRSLAPSTGQWAQVQPEIVRGALRPAHSFDLANFRFSCFEITQHFRPSLPSWSQIRPRRSLCSLSGELLCFPCFQIVGNFCLGPAFSPRIRPLKMSVSSFPTVGLLSSFPCSENSKNSYTKPAVFAPACARLSFLNHLFFFCRSSVCALVSFAKVR